jgi:hypothetical protein
MALILVLGGGRLAARMFPAAERATGMTPSLQPVAFSVLGAVILTSALPTFVREFAMSEIWREGSSTIHLLNSNAFWQHDAPILLRMLLGLALFLGSGPLTRFWRWMHTAGLERGPAT